jgi:hypothetical protein
VNLPERGKGPGNEQHRGETDGIHTLLLSERTTLSQGGGELKS